MGEGGYATGHQFARAANRDAGFFTYYMGNDSSLRGAIEYLKKLKAWGFEISSVAIYDHGMLDSKHNKYIGQQYNKTELFGLPNARNDMCEFGSLLQEDAIIDLMACEIGAYPVLLNRYARAFNRDVRGSSLDTKYSWANILLNWYR